MFNSEIIDSDLHVQVHDRPVVSPSPSPPGYSRHPTAPLRRTFMSLLRVDASIQGPVSASSALADLVLAEFTAARPDEPVVTRHLGQQPVPAGAWALAIGGAFTPEADRTLIEREFTLVGVNPALDEFSAMAGQMKQAAEEAAAKAGRSLADQ